jgi:predicted  nucleic acid-binding Zn-ribbon protein
MSPEMAKKMDIQKDELGELTQEQQLRLQMIMDRMSQLEQAISNILKKIADTQNQIIQNMKG